MLESIGRAGELRIHPGTGKMILPAADSGRIGQNNPVTEMGTNLYEASVENGVPVFRQFDRIEGAGLWELRTAAVGSDLYLGTGMAGPNKQDGSPGGIYRIGGGDGTVYNSTTTPGTTSSTTSSTGTAVTGSQDAVPAQQIDWVAGGDAANWPVTTELDVNFKRSNLIFEHDGSWKQTIKLDGESLAGNYWIGTRGANGQWQMCPFEWFRAGQHNCRAGAATEEGHLLGGMRAPKSGEEVLFMVSTPARGSQRTSNERSQIISARWP
jgi:hypothetical protein